MPRPQRVRPQPIPKVRPEWLNPRDRAKIADYLGLASLPDGAAAGIAHDLAAYEFDRSSMKGFTPRRCADELRRVGECLHRAMVALGAITGHALDGETSELMLAQAEALTAQIAEFREQAIARAAALDAMRASKPEHEKLTHVVGRLRLIFGAFAEPHVQGNDANLRGFVLECLDAYGIDTGELKVHPDRLREMLKVRVMLLPPDWPRTPAVWA